MSDRRLWLDDACPSCGARPGLRCQTWRYDGKPTLFLHSARGWRHRPCPACKAPPGELCRTPSGRQATRPHTARFPAGGGRCFPTRGCGRSWSGGMPRPPSFVSRAEVVAGGQHWRGHARGRREARARSVGSGGGGSSPEALAAPIWGRRYALFRGHPRMTGLLVWDVKERCVLVAGERGGEKFDQVLVSKLVSGTRQTWLRETAKQAEQQPCA